MLQAMGDLERTWNSKFNYPWSFFSEVEFTKEFKEKTRAATKADCRYCTYALALTPSKPRL
jgi:mannosyltransferase